MLAEQYTDTSVVSLATHKFLKLIEVNPYFEELPKIYISNEPFNFMLEVYMDDYIELSIPRIQDQPHHVDNTIMKGIHDVFSLDKDDKEYAISLKKIIKEEAALEIIQNVLGFVSEKKTGEHTRWLTEDRRTNILTKLKKWNREG